MEQICIFHFQLDQQLQLAIELRVFGRQIQAKEFSPLATICSDNYSIITYFRTVLYIRKVVVCTVENKFFLSFE
jgi:hypothetical protein